MNERVIPQKWLIFPKFQFFLLFQLHFGHQNTSWEQILPGGRLEQSQNTFSRRDNPKMGRVGTGIKRKEGENGSARSCLLVNQIFPHENPVSQLPLDLQRLEAKAKDFSTAGNWTCEKIFLVGSPVRPLYHSAFRAQMFWSDGQYIKVRNYFLLPSVENQKKEPF